MTASVDDQRKPFRGTGLPSEFVVDTTPLDVEVPAEMIRTVRMPVNHHPVETQAYHLINYFRLIVNQPDAAVDKLQIGHIRLVGFK